MKLPPETDWARLHGSTLAVEVGTKVLLLDLPSGKEFNRCPIPNRMGNICLSSDNKRIAFSDSAALEVWDLTTHKMLHRLKVSPNEVFLSPDGRFLVVRTNADHIYWCVELAINKKFPCCERAEVSNFPVAFSPDGRMVAVRNGLHGIRVFEVSTGKDRLRQNGLSEKASALSFSSDGKTLASGDDQNVRLWSMQTGKEIQVLRGHQGKVLSVCFSPNGRKLVSGSHDLTALIWDIPPESLHPKPQVVYLGREERDKLWGKLAAVDAAAAYAGLQRLAAVDAQAVSLCRERLFELPTTPTKQIESWITQLDDEDFTIREEATNNLERVEGDAKNALESALKRDCSPEKKQRLEALLETLNSKQLPTRVLRAVELLEQIGTTDAVDVLRRLEKKTGDTAVRDDVRRSLDRLLAKRIER